ncbi:MAG: TonB-dependent receptor [Paludibacteraceae bacterium]|nr:TonB-dependent receptor [Paludibacteraceae bacterium]
MKFLKKSRIIRFRQFSNKAYAAFQSLHREVTIGCVASYIAEKEMLKQGKHVAVRGAAIGCMALGLGLDAMAQSETVGAMTPQDSVRQFSVQELVVTAHKAELQSEAFRMVSQISRDEIQSLPVQTLADILQYLPGLDVRTRGANGGQADVSMRGGTFDQVLVMVNGVNLSDAHTGHYAMNLPLPAGLIERIEVLEGTSANLFGVNAFSGAINIVTKSSASAADAASPSTGSGLQASEGMLALTAGMNGLVNPSASASWSLSHVHINAGAEYSRWDGYAAPSPSEKEQKGLDNSDGRLANLYLELKGTQAIESPHHWDVQLGAQYKDAGAGMFYGFGSQDQFDATRTAFGSAKYAYRAGAFSTEAQVSYRANYDRYEWHRGQRLYGNFHLSQTAAASLKAAYLTRIGKSQLGVEVRNENIHSTNLGDTVNAAGQVPNVDGFDLKDLQVLNLVKGKNRLNINYFAEQTFHYRELSASLGVSGNYNTMFGNNVAGGANIGYQYAQGSSVYVNANRSLRMPTFTDLYYNAGNQLGNRDLKPEKAWTLSVGTRYVKQFSAIGKHSVRPQLSVMADAYYRWGEDIIDWVYVADDAKRPYHAMNQQRVNSCGLEAGVTYRHNEWLRLVQASYAYTYLDLNLKEAGSRYLDYLSHKLVLRLEHGLYVSDSPEQKGVLAASWSLRYQQREGEYNDAEGAVQAYQPVLLLDGSLYWENAHLRISADCSNMTNRRYYDYGGLLQAGAWAKMTVTAKF